MRTMILSTLLLFTLSANVPAALLAFKEIETGFISVPQGKVNLTVRGYWAYDTDSGMMSEIGITTIGGTRYYIINTNFGQHTVTRAASSGRDQFIVSRAVSSNSVDGFSMKAAYYKGPAYPLVTGLGSTFDFALTLRGITRSIEPVGGQSAFAESAISMSFSPTETKKANAAAETLTDFLNRWRQYYQSRGYVALPTE